MNSPKAIQALASFNVTPIGENGASIPTPATRRAGTASRRNHTRLMRSATRSPTIPMPAVEQEERTPLPLRLGLCCCRQHHDEAEHEERRHDDGNHVVPDRRRTAGHVPEAHTLAPEEHRKSPALPALPAFGRHLQAL